MSCLSKTISILFI